MGGAREKDWPKRPSDHHLQVARKKKTDRAIAPAWRQSVSLHTWCHQGHCSPSKSKKDKASWISKTLDGLATEATAILSLPAKVIGWGLKGLSSLFK